VPIYCITWPWRTPAGTRGYGAAPPATHVRRLASSFAHALAEEHVLRRTNVLEMEGSQRSHGRGRCSALIALGTTAESRNGGVEEVDAVQRLVHAQRGRDGGTAAHGGESNS
jgi:hypothetical protein